MLLLGIDVGTSSIKVSVVDADTLHCIVSAQYPENEAPIISLQTGWAEQNPNDWWHYIQQAILKLHSTKKYNPANIKAIGIAYQMHGLVMVDKDGNSLRNSIIWCDSRAIQYGEIAFNAIGEKECLDTLLNSPGNFTASKLAWVKENEPEIYNKINKIMLPGDFISYKLTGTITTSASALSEGIMWNFKNNTLANSVLDYFHFPTSFIPAISNVFATHGLLKNDIAKELELPKGIPISYKAGDQPNNALSLNVLKPGEVAATAGTSGVIYGVANSLVSDSQTRVNSFAHVNHTATNCSIGVLLCINGCGILNKFIRQNFGSDLSYAEMNEAAQMINIGSEGLGILPFGNGAERMLGNKLTGAQILNIDLNKHTPSHFYRAAQEGIAFAFRYGLDILKENGMNPTVIKAGKANMFLSNVFANAFVNTTGVPVELYNADGSIGAAWGAAIGANIIKEDDLLKAQNKIEFIEPNNKLIECYENIYQDWKQKLLSLII